MNILKVTIIAILPFLLQCKKEQADLRLKSMPTDLKLSSHPRASAAAARVYPTLESDLQNHGMTLGDPIFLRAFKEEKLLEVFVKRKDSEKFDLFRSYPIAATSGVLGPKLAEGDGQVPEGFYFSSEKDLNPNSNYHLSFNIGYPNAYDRFHKRTGSHIMIHGSNVSIGCLAMTDEKIEEIFTLADAALHNGQPFFRINIFPFRMTEERMADSQRDANQPFWDNLREGYEFFERTGNPPDVSVENGKYILK